MAKSTDSKCFTFRIITFNCFWNIINNSQHCIGAIDNSIRNTPKTFRRIVNPVNKTIIILCARSGLTYRLYIIATDFTSYQEITSIKTGICQRIIHSIQRFVQVFLLAQSFFWGESIVGIYLQEIITGGKYNDRHNCS